MIRSLKCQALGIRQYVAVTLLATFGSFIYSWLMGGGRTNIIVFRVTSYITVAAFLWVFTQTYFSVYTPMALSCGATRRGWFFASVVTQVTYGALAGGVLLLAAEPLASWLFNGQAQIPWHAAPLVLSLCIFIVCFGGMLGFITLRYGTKAMLVILFGVILLVVGVFIFGIAFWPAKIINIPLNGAVPPLIILALSAGAQGVNWRALRCLAVKG